MSRLRATGMVLPAAAASDELPERLRPFFWDCDFDRLTWGEHHAFVMRRVLSVGSWDVVCWLRRRVGDVALRAWIEEHGGRGLSPAQLRFWELVLELPAGLVDTWLACPERSIWDGRHGR
ncbi:MAG: hypothetical protein MUF48_18150 [Pirellulaceae bacterium]|nr:hypothetical protein [Pirellulaceae bacterium]